MEEATLACRVPSCRDVRRRDIFRLVVRRVKCPLLGVKRTCRFALHMSAYDPKRTSTPIVPAGRRAA